MKRYGHLFESVCSFDRLFASSRKAMKGKQHKPHIASFYLNLEKELLSLQRELQTGTYRPRPYHCFEIYEPKRRYICAADIRDRVVHHAVCSVLEPFFERFFIHDSYACRKEKGTLRAIRRTQTFARKNEYFFKSDISKFFASIDHDILKQLLCRKFKDEKLLRLMAVIIDHPVPGHPPGKGLAIGNLTSQWWANFYLNTLDQFVINELRIKNYVRYMDDFLIFSNDKTMLHETKSRISRFLLNRLQLELKEASTCIAPVQQGIPFLGHRIFPGTVRLNHRTKHRFFRKMKEKEHAFETGDIDDDAFIRSVSSLVGHISHADTWQLRQKLFFPTG